MWLRVALPDNVGRLVALAASCVLLYRPLYGDVLWGVSTVAKKLVVVVAAAVARHPDLGPGGGASADGRSQNNGVSR